MLKNQAELEKLIVEKMVEGLKTDQLKEPDLPKIASFVLKRIERINNQDQLVGFLSQLSLKWPIFTSLAKFEEAKLQRVVETKIAGEVLQLIRSNQINNAIQLAKSYIN